MRSAQRWLEGIAEPLETRYLRWGIQFDEAGRTALYSNEWIDALVTAGAQAPDDADPASVLERAFAAAPSRDPVTRAMVADLLTYLPGDLLVKVDLASMAHSLECRGPFLDHRVVELAMAMPASRKLRIRGGRSKAILKQAFPELLPTAIRHRAKMGFGVPVDRWFRGPLKDELRAVLLDPVSQSRGLFRPETVAKLVDEHIDAKRDHAYRLWNLLILELWFRNHIDTRAA
jgi:asparagine synthase (glutamine-hydrolysing)